MSRITAFLLVVAFCIVCGEIVKASAQIDGCSGFDVNGNPVLATKPPCQKGQDPSKDSCCPTVDVYGVDPDWNAPSEKKKHLQEEIWQKENAYQPTEQEKEKQKEQSAKPREERDGWVPYDATGGSKPQADLSQDKGRPRDLKPGEVSTEPGKKETLPMPEGGIYMKKVEDGDHERSTGMPPSNDNGGWIENPPPSPLPMSDDKAQLAEPKKRTGFERPEPQVDFEHDKGKPRELKPGEVTNERFPKQPTYGQQEPPTIVPTERPTGHRPGPEPQAEIEKRPQPEMVPGEMRPAEPKPTADIEKDRDPRMRPGDISPAPNGQSGGSVTPINIPLPQPGREGMAGSMENKGTLPTPIPRPEGSGAMMPMENRGTLPTPIPRPE